MGKGRIVSVGPGAGQYDLDAVRDVTRIDKRIAFLTARLAALQISISIAETDEAAKLAALQAAKTALTDAVAGYNADPPTVTADELQKIQKAYIDALGAHAAAISTVSKLRLEKTSLEKEKMRLQAIPEKVRHAGAWCVDYTIDLAVNQEVGTIEIDGEDDRILIVPGGKPYTAAMGKLQPVCGAPNSAAAWNWAMLPGWQRWKPTYRIGTIASIDYEGNTCNIMLDAARSLAQGLTINQAPTLSNVPIEYMFFNASVFLVGDRIVVQFQGQDWSNPKVIGFESNPRPELLYLAQFKALQPLNSCPYNPALGRYGVHTDPEITMSFQEFGNDELNPLPRCIPELDSGVPPEDWYFLIDYTFNPSYWEEKYPGGYGDIYIGAFFGASEGHIALGTTYRLKLEITTTGVTNYAFLQINGEEIYLGPSDGTFVVTRDILLEESIGVMMLVRGLGSVSMKIFSILPVAYYE